MDKTIEIMKTILVWKTLLQFSFNRIFRIEEESRTIKISLVVLRSGDNMADILW